MNRNTFARFGYIGVNSVNSTPVEHHVAEFSGQPSCRSRDSKGNSSHSSNSTHTESNIVIEDSHASSSHASKISGVNKMNKKKIKSKGKMECEYCCKKFKMNDDLTQHKASSHGIYGSTFKFSCHLCPQKFKRSIIFQNHKIREHGMYNENKTENNRKKHKPSEENFNGDPSVVDWCGNYLDEPPVPTINCKLCNKISSNKEDLEKHTMIAHNPDFKFECNICRRTFEEDIYLKLHKEGFGTCIDNKNKPEQATINYFA